MKLRDTKIGTRLGIGFGILVALMAALVVISMATTGTMHRDLRQVIDLNNAKIQTANDLKDGIKTVNLAIFASLVSKDEAAVSQNAALINEGRTKYKAAVDLIEKLEKTDKGKDIIKALKENIASGREGNAQAMEAAKAGKSDEGVSIFTAKVLPAALKGFAICDELIKYQQEEMNAAGARGDASYRSTFALLAIIGIVVVGAAIGMTYLLRRGIVQGVEKGINITEMLAAGRLNFEIEVDAKDELGAQAAAMKTVVEKWRGIIRSIQQTSDSVAAAGTQLSASAEQMSKGAGQQAERAHQVATASEEMSQTVEDIARNASSIATTAAQAAGSAKDGGKTVEAAVKEVREIADRVDESASHITSLAALSKKIGDIIGIINEIADQTNLLALNAAIEAARAGEHGRGFAVVADEVRKLAERTTGATSEVSNIIREIQDKVGSAVSSIEQVSSKVDRGVDLSSKAGEELGTIVKGVEELQTMVQQIATAIEEMSATSDQISKDIESISGISGETSRASDEVLNASGELSRLGSGLQGIARQFEV
jgi:methyl-accepting chemotaxis protein